MPIANQPEVLGSPYRPLAGKEGQCAGFYEGARDGLDKPCRRQPTHLLETSRPGNPLDGSATVVRQRIHLCPACYEKREEQE